MKISPASLKLTQEMIRVSESETLSLTPSALALLCDRLTHEDASRYAIVFNLIPTITTVLECSFEQAVLHALQLRRTVCLDVFNLALLKLADKINPHHFDLRPIEFEVEGFGANKGFMGFSEDFYTTKRLHFDIVEPLSSNLYGPNVNISGGFPVFADVGKYCRELGIEPIRILEKIPGTRLLSIQREHYLSVLRSYTTAYEVNMHTDTPFTLYVNSVNHGGIMHGATDPIPTMAGIESRRPLSHLSLDSNSSEDMTKWYGDLGHVPERRDGDPEQVFLLTDGLKDKSIQTVTLN